MLSNRRQKLDAESQKRPADYLVGLNRKDLAMKIVQAEKAGIVCITINSNMNGLNTSEAEKSIRQTLKEDKNQLVLDLGALEYLRSTVLRMILDIVKEMKHKNGQVVLCNLNKYVKEIFEVSGHGIYLQFSDSVDSGVAALS